jgi:hypothetical protein
VPVKRHIGRLRLSEIAGDPEKVMGGWTVSNPESFEDISKSLRNVTNRQVEWLDRIGALEQRLEGALGRLSKIEDRVARLEKVTDLRTPGYAR